MLILGSCCCESVRFEIETPWFYPFMWCYCGTCRKTSGSPVSPFIKGKRENLKILGGESEVRVFEIRTNERAFCGRCGSSLYLTDTRWPESCWIQASVIDTPLPECPEIAHIFVGSKAPWFPIHTPGPQFDEYPDRSIDDWHRDFPKHPSRE